MIGRYGIVGLLLLAALIGGCSGGAKSGQTATSSGVPTSDTQTAITPSVIEQVPGDCPADSSKVVHPAFRPAAGDGPVYMMLGLHPNAGQRTLAYYPSKPQMNFAPGWGGTNLTFLVSPTYPGPITLSGSTVGAGELDFVGPSETVLLPLGVQGGTGWPVTSVTLDGWRLYGVTATIPLDHPGCYTVTLSGTGLSERITFWAELQPAPTPTPASGPRPTPKPPTEWMPYLRMLGRSYLAVGMGFAAGATPPLSIDPAMAGRQVGTIQWNVRDETTDQSYSSRDGSSAILAVGTPVYALKGYREDFRLLAETDYGWRVFEADGLNGAKTVADVLAIRGKVNTVTGTREGPDGRPMTVGEVTDAAQVASLVDLILAQPVTFTGTATQPPAAPPQLQLWFLLKDGTTTAWNFYVGGWEWSQGIPVTPEFFSQLQRVLTGQ